MTSPLLLVERFSFSYEENRKFAVNEVSFELAAGETLTIIGPPKAGKTTLGLALAGILPRFFPRASWDGSVSVAGVEAGTETFEHFVRRTGFLMEHPTTQLSGIRPTVFSEVAGVLQNLGVPRIEIGPRVFDILDQLRLRGLSERNPQELSGGETQRLALASILVKDPDLIVLDQPFAHLDSNSAAQVWRVVNALAKRGKGIVILESDASNGYAVSRELRLEGGKLISDGALHTPVWKELARSASTRAGLEFDNGATCRDCLRLLKRIGDRRRCR